MKCLQALGVDIDCAETMTLRLIDDLDGEHEDEIFGVDEITGVHGKFDQAKAAARVREADLALREASLRRGSQNSETWHKCQLAADEFHRTLDLAYPPGFWEILSASDKGSLRRWTWLSLFSKMIRGSFARGTSRRT